MSRPDTYRNDGGRWAKARAGHLAHEPFCRPCKKAGRTVRATTVDHIIPHRGDMKLFWNRKNWQSLCSTCSNGDKQRQERSGGKPLYRGCTEDGTPLDPNHAWRKQELDANPAGRDTSHARNQLVGCL